MFIKRGIWSRDICYSNTHRLRRNPDRILALTVYEVEQQWVNSKKVGRFLAPVVASLDFDDFFGGTSMCLIQELSGLNNGECADVQSIALMVKKGVRSTSDGWLCDYHTKCKVIVLDDST